MIRTDLIAPVTELLERQAAAMPGKLAFEDATRAVTYGQLERETRNMAGQMRAIGLQPGGSVGIWLSNSVDWVVATLAAIRTGGVAVPIPADAKPREVAYRLGDAAIDVLVTHPDTLPVLEKIERRKGLHPGRIIATGRAPGHVLNFDDLIATPAATSLPPEDIDAVSLLVYTSGTTGQPKGVQLTTRSMLWVNAACWNPIFGMGMDDVILSPLPLFHSYALNFCLLSIIANGASEYIMERFSTESAMALLDQGRFTLMPGVPTIFHYLMLAATETGRNPFQTIRRCVSAGAIMPAALNTEFEDRFGIELLDGYGITETSTMVTLNWPGPGRVPGSCGLPLPGLAVRLIDPSTGKDAKQGVEGELICRGPNVMQGYLNKPEATASALRDGWYHTGDLARADANGFLTITGRLKELIIRGGQNIAPAEVEETIVQMDGVRDCAVVGVSHKTLGEVPVAFIVPEDAKPPDLQAIRAFCDDRLPTYKHPNAVKSIREIPRTGSGKIMRFKLRDMFEAEIRPGKQGQGT
ncbi:MAG: class I adenylate-forming enzyme family protein [Roseovarius sp.]|nr:class I adenylate-forming enzyme family protein [Roseovarius sp.]MCY4291898.1 class I adenylate-forming enzyme family protein [Roseovarius sp.]MCY4317286.1 class I adenylate-forming enzyme family protein [Roseovarius sp.]